MRNRANKKWVKPRMQALWVWLCPLKTHMLKFEPLVPDNVTLFGNRVIAE